MRTVNVGYKRLHPEAFVPAYATEESACFDVRACFPAGRRQVEVWTKDGHQSVVMAFSTEVRMVAGSKTTIDHPLITLQPGDRALIPTQLVLVIPSGYSVRLHMRSGLALKGGLVLSNSEGVVDSDYLQQLYVPITNASAIPVSISHGDRICQGEVVERIFTEFSEIADLPDGKTSRNGGFGSTGKA